MATTKKNALDECKRLIEEHEQRYHHASDEEHVSIHDQLRSQLNVDYRKFHEEWERGVHERLKDCKAAVVETRFKRSLWSKFCDVIRPRKFVVDFEQPVAKREEVHHVLSAEGDVEAEKKIVDALGEKNKWDIADWRKWFANGYDEAGKETK
jgi:hypothetical protein